MFFKKNYSNYYKCAKSSADLGDSEGQREVGFCFFKGIYVEKDLKKLLIGLKRLVSRAMPYHSII